MPDPAPTVHDDSRKVSTVAAISTPTEDETVVGLATSPLQAQHVQVGYGDVTIVQDASFSIPSGKITTIIGPNGCGKSTLLRTLSRLLTPTSGTVLLNGKPLHSQKSKDIALQLALLPQGPVAPEGLTVADLVARGRTPHQPWYRQWTHTDELAVQHAMTATGVVDLAERPLESLSGGQRQRAWIAMALAQETDILLLDEPTTYLDLAYAVDVLELVVQLRRDTGRTVVMVLHELALAARYSDHLIVVKGGEIITQGHPTHILTAELLFEVFGLTCRVTPDPHDGFPNITPITHA